MTCENYLDDADIEYFTKWIRKNYPSLDVISFNTMDEQLKTIIKILKIYMNENYNYGLEIDDVIYPKTYVYISLSCNINYITSDSNDIIYILRLALYCRGYKNSLNGVYDNELKKRIKEFQKDNGLKISIKINGKFWYRLLTIKEENINE